MPQKTQLAVLFFFVLLISKISLGQSTQSTQYLQKVGILDSLYSETLKEQRHFYIDFPLDYDANSNQKYPVVFVLDGKVLLPTVSNVQQFYSGGFTPEMILVGISNSENRRRDLTTSKVKELFGMPFNQESGGAGNFMKFIENELIPYVESKYPVTDFRTLIGHSYGGLFTINALIHHSHLFSNYIAIDPSLDWDGQKLLTESETQLSNGNYQGKSLFVSLSGQLHKQDPGVTIDNVMQDSSDFTLFSRSNIMFSELVNQNQKNGLAFGWKFYPRDLHGTVPFPTIHDGLIFDFEWFQMENTDKFNSPATSKEELFDIINYRADKLERHFKYPVAPYPEDVLNVLGYMSMDMDQPEKAKMFFEFAIQFYPQSINTYDSMAEYYERNNDRANAMKYLTKAYEMSGNESYKQRIQTLKNKK